MLENIENFCGADLSSFCLLSIIITVRLLPRTPELETVSSDSWLAGTTASPQMLNTPRPVINWLIHLTHHFRFTEAPNGIKTLLGVSDFDSSRELWICGLVQQDFTTVHADALADFLDPGHKTNVEHRLGKLNMAEVSRTLLHVLRACLASEISID
ncbi:hypothetical protein OGATHE_006523 [Ogataea polymorpha]|uniref:Uncharacterized protein n=1 Tax=Ogataea polymorpha TaxID=460523 RepID=A0A9P8NTB6_9ASCO|nr:hypothetical protein OGATHE_006523 [Ogataea polymorpha]